MNPWEAAGYDNPEDWAAAGWPQPINPETGEPWQGYEMFRMFGGRHPTGRKMTDDDWRNPYTQAIFDFLRHNRAYDNPLWDWYGQMRAKYPDYPLPGVNVQELLRKAFPEWYEEGVAPEEAPAVVPTVTPTAGEIAPEGVTPEITEVAPTITPEMQKWLEWARGRRPPTLAAKGPLPTEKELDARRRRIREWYAYLPPEMRARLARPAGVAAEEVPEKAAVAPTEGLQGLLARLRARKGLLARLRARIGELPEEAKRALVPITGPAPEMVLPTTQLPRQPAIGVPKDLTRMLAERLWPGWLEGIQRRITVPSKEFLPGLERDARELLGSFNATLHGVPEVPELETPERAWEMTKGFYGAWFTPVFDIFQRVDDAKNAVLSIADRQVEKSSIYLSPHVSPESPFYNLPRVYADPSTRGGEITLALQKQYEEETGQKWFYTPEEWAQIDKGLLTRNEAAEAIKEGQYIFDKMFMDYTTREDMRERVRSGELTLEEAINEYSTLPSGIEMLLQIGTSAWWLPLPGMEPLMKVAFAPISIPAKGLWAAAKHMPIISHLIQWSKMTKVNRAGNDAVNAFRKMTREVVPQEADVPFSGPIKSRLQLFADDLATLMQGGPAAILERYPHLTDNEAQSLARIFEQANILGVDPAQMIATATSKANVFNRIGWMARMQKAAELGISLEKDATLLGESRAMLMDLWLSSSWKYIVNNTMDDFSKAVMHGYYPNPLGAGNYVEQASKYGWDLPEFVAQTQLAQLRGARRVSSIGRLGLPLISRPEHWATGYGANFLEMILGKRTANRLISKATQSVMLLHEPNAGLLKKVLAGTIDNANIETFFWAGRELNYLFQRGLRGGVFVEAATEHVALNKGEWVDDVARFAEEAGWSADEIARLRSYLDSPLVRSVDDAVGRANLALGGEEGAVVYGLSDYKIRAQGKMGEPLFWVSEDLQRLEQQGRATEETVGRTFDTGRRMVQGVINAADEVAKGRTPVSSVLDDILDIKGIQEGRRGVARDYLHTTMTQIEKAWVEGQIADDVYESARTISRQTETKAGGLVGRTWEKENEALLKLNQQIEDLAGQYRKGQIDVVEFSIRKGQAIYDYMWGKTAIRALWDKTNDKYVKIVQAGAYRMQRATGVYPEPLSAELTMQLAKYQRIESRIQETFKRDFLGKIVNDAEQALDELGRWEDEALGKLKVLPEKRVAEAVAPEVARPDRAPLINHIIESWQSLLDEAEKVGTEMVDHIMFNYGDKAVAQEGAQRFFIPFITWQIRNPLYYLEHFQEIPGLFNAVRLIETKTDEMRQERGLTSRFKYTLPATGAIEFVPGMPEGYYGIDIRPFISVMSQLAIFNPFGEPYQWSDETSLGKLARSGEWLGMSSYPWWQYVLSQLEIGQSPDLAYISPITRAVRDWTGLDIGHITEQDQYYAALELAGRVAIGEISKLDALQAIYSGYETEEPNDLWNDALATSQDQQRRIDRLAMWLPGALKYASPNELRVREQLEQFRAQPPTKEIKWDEWPAVSTYFFIWSSPEEKREQLAYEERGERIRQLNAGLLSVAQERRVGDKYWRKEIDLYWEARDAIDAEYEPIIGKREKEDRYRIRFSLQDPIDAAVNEYRAIADTYLDPETGELKEGYDWGDVAAEQQTFRAQLVMGTADRPPLSLTAFDQALLYWEPVATAKLRAWELLYGDPVWKIIADTKDLENRDVLIAEAKRLANSGRYNDAELTAEILRIHPDWTKEQVNQAMKVKLADWDAWGRKNQPLHDALVGVMWTKYMALDDLARKEFRTFIEEHPDIDPRISILFEKIILPREMEKAKTIWYRDMKLLSPKALLILVDKLGGLIDLQKEGFQAEIEKAEKEYELEPIERETPEAGFPPPLPATAEELYAREAEAQGLTTVPGHPSDVPMHDPASLEQVARQQPSWPGDYLGEQETQAFKEWAFSEAGFTPEAQKEFEEVTLKVNRSVGGGGGWRPSSWSIELGSPSLETTIHEYAHAWYHNRRDDLADDLVAATFKLAEETDPQYQRAADLARVYINGDPNTGFPGMKTEPGQGGGPNKEWIDWEIFAGLASGIMGDLNQLPPYMRKFYGGLFTGETATKEQPDFWPAMATRKLPTGRLAEDELARMWTDYQNPQYPIAGMVSAWAHNRFKTSEEARTEWEKIPQADREAAVSWFYGQLWPNVEEHPERFGDELKLWQDIKDFLSFMGKTEQAQTGRPPGKAAPMPFEPTEESPAPPAPAEEEPPLPRYPGGVFVPTATPEEEAEYDEARAQMQSWVAGGKQADWTPLMEKWFGRETPAGNFWEFYWAEIPPGPFAEEVRKDPIIEMLLNKAFRTVYDVKEGVYEQALETLQAWRKAHPEVPGDPKEWAIVRKIVNKYWELKNAGATNEASALWRYFADLLERYYPNQRVTTTRRRYRRARGGGGSSKWRTWRGWRRWPKIRYYPKR